MGFSPGKKATSLPEKNFFPAVAQKSVNTPAAVGGVCGAKFPK